MWVPTVTVILPVWGEMDYSLGAGEARCGDDVSREAAVDDSPGRKPGVRSNN
jgi:hypothetical protein